MYDQRLVLITLLIKLGVAAAISSVLARSRRFRVLLFHEDRSLRENIEMVLFITLPYALGVIVRATVKNFLAADLSFESSILMGVIAGPIAGTFGGLLVSIPSILIGEWANLPLNLLAGFSAGFLRSFSKNREAIWSFSPLFDLSIYRWIRRTIQKSFIDWQTSFFVLLIGLQFVRFYWHELIPRRTFALDSPSWLIKGVIYLSTVMCVAIALKVLNNTRIEMKLEEQARLLLQARMEALQSQINPHFLFNTLNSVSSLVRFNPDAARGMILKLANILRRLLRKGDSFVQLREEMEFIDDYLDIEVVRFGREKLKIVKVLEPKSLEVMVPAVILQPIVENALKHGLSPKVEGGSLHLRSHISDGMLVVEIEDDGVGMDAPKGDNTGFGIGLANVRERLNVLYSDSARVEIESKSQAGTLIRLVLPIPQTDDYGISIHDFRSSTSR